MGFLSNRIAVEDLHPGDHIYSWRIGYTYGHHGVYNGGGRVIHFTRGRDQELGTGTSLDRLLASSAYQGPPHQRCQDCGTDGQSHGVVESCLPCFLCGGPLYMFEYGVDWRLFLAKGRGGTCTMAPSDGAEEVLHRARLLLQRGFGRYDLLDNNCEHFALYCCTGRLLLDTRALGASGQIAASFGVPISAVLSSPLALLTTSPATMATAALGLYCSCRYAHDIGVRTDVVHVSVEELTASLEQVADGERALAAKRMLGQGRQGQGAPFRL